MAICQKHGSDDADLTFGEAAEFMLQNVIFDFLNFLNLVHKFDMRLNKEVTRQLMLDLGVMFQTLSPSLTPVGSLGIGELHETLIKIAAESLVIAAKNIKLPGIFLRHIDKARECISLVDGLYIGIAETDIALEEAAKIRREELTLAARKRHEKDPKQREKLFVKECWQNWQKMPIQYRSKAAFSRAMIEKCEHLTSSKKIEDWCREWEGQK